MYALYQKESRRTTRSPNSHMIDSPPETASETPDHQLVPGTRRKRTLKWLIVLTVLGCNTPDGDTPDGEAAEQLAIPVEDAKYLQDVEHLGGFVLGDLAFPKITQALRDQDESELTAFFDSQFEGVVFDSRDGSDGTVVRYPFATFRVLREEEDARHSCGSSEFVRTLLEYRNEFEQLESSGLKVMQMSPETYGQLDGRWVGTMKLILAGRTSKGEVAHYVINFRCRISGISDETPNQRGWMLSCEMLSARHRLSKDYLMRDMTADTGIKTQKLLDNWNSPPGVVRPFVTGGIFTCDYNRDGLVDVFLTDLNGSSFYAGRPGGKFVDVTEQVGLPVTRALGAAFADLDNDGYEDLILGQMLYRNDQGKRFVSVAPRSPAKRLNPMAMYHSIVDYDRDGLLDVYVIGLMAQRHTEHRWIGDSDVQFNELWHNLGDWQFENVTEASGTKGSGSPTFAAAWFDANGDDWPDVMTACELGTNDYFVNQGDGTFRQGDLPDGYGGFSMGITVSDIDNDGFGDPYVANMYSKAGARIVGNLREGIYDADVDLQMRDFVEGNELYRNQGDGTFDRIGLSAGINDIGWTYGVGYADLNGDGLPDIYSPAGFQSVSPNKPDG